MRAVAYQWPWICRQPRVTWWHPGPCAQLGVFGTVAPRGGPGCRDASSAARTHGVGVGHAFGEGAFCGVTGVKENPGTFRWGKQARALSSLLNIFIRITFSYAIHELEKPLLTA